MPPVGSPSSSSRGASSSASSWRRKIGAAAGLAALYLAGCSSSLSSVQQQLLVRAAPPPPKAPAAAPAPGGSLLAAAKGAGPGPPPVPEGAGTGPPPPWWEPAVAADRERPGGGLVVRECPVPFKPRSNNGQRLVQILRVLDRAAASRPPPGRRPPSRGGTVVDVGLPEESVVLARAGYRVQAFEARRSGYEQVLERLDRDLRGRALRGRVQLHRAALSNYTGATEIYDASTSSSLLEGAVANGAVEEKKFDKEGRRTETVPVTTLDDHFRSLASAGGAGAAAAPPAAAAAVVVGMKVDTQGVEPEIFMGARSLLEDPARRPLAIVFEYCTRLRPFDELSVGLHLLLGLGYSCYYPRGNALSRKHGASAVVTEDTEVCSDFYCTSEPLPPGNATAGAP